MAKLVFSMMQSLDGYVDIGGPDGGPGLPAPGQRLSRHFTDEVRDIAGLLYGRRIYEIMRYWDVDQPDWDALDHEFAAIWRGKPKWVASRTLTALGPNATLIRGDLDAFARKLKHDVSGEIDVAGPELAGSLTALGLVDEYRLYFRPFVLHGRKPFFAGSRPPLHLVGAESVGEDAVRLTYTVSR